MRGTQIVAGMAMLAIIGAITSYPVNAKAAPQLAVATTGVGVAPQIGTGSIAGGRRAINTAKTDKNVADARAKELNGLMDEGEKSHEPDLSGLANKVYSASELITGVQKSGSKKFEGSLVNADGIVLKVVSKPDSTVVYVGAPKDADKSPIFAFRMPAGKVFKEGDRAALEGTFIGKMKVDGMPNDVYLVNSVEGKAAQSVAPEKPRLPYDGWKFVGSVENEAGATGVFVKEGKTLYAQPGDELSDDVKVLGLKSGEATLRDSGTKSVVSPW